VNNGWVHHEDAKSTKVTKKRKRGMKR